MSLLVMQYHPGQILHFPQKILLGITAFFRNARIREEVTRLLETYQQKKHYVRLKDGSFMRLREGTLALLNELVRGMAHFWVLLLL